MYQFIGGIFGVAPTQQDAIAISKLSDDYVIMNSGTGDVKTFRTRFLYFGRAVERRGRLFSRRTSAKPRCC